MAATESMPNTQVQDDHPLPRSSPPSITIRLATFADMPAIAHLCAAALMDDSLVGETMHSNRGAHPHDVSLSFLRGLRVKHWEYKCVIEIATLQAAEVEMHIDRSGKNINDASNDVVDVLSKEDRDKVNDVGLVTVAGGREVVVGVVHWTRFGKDENARARLPGQFDPRNLMAPLTQRAMNLHEFIYPNRAADPVNYDIATRSAPYWLSLFASPPRSECWYLSKCAVHPYFQGLGIGKNMVAIGTARASREGVCAALTSALGKDGFYQNACGFQEQYGDMCAGEGNPMGLLSGRGGKVYWFWPEGVVRPEQEEE
ncbi:GNAT family N-acetyltransferase [Microdochium nivale]|nr:GNAT family N-acetyltransferase [Microdochium nivale]